MTGSTWPQEYYDLLEFYYWEPQWLNRQAKPAPGKKFSVLLENIRKSEVSLNHILNIFFAVVPNALVQQLFQCFLNYGMRNEHFLLQGRQEKSSAAATHLCQPDHLSVSENSRVAIEIKIGFKTSLEQLIKYAIYLESYRKADTNKSLYLLYLSPKLKTIWSGNTTFQSYAADLDTFEFTESISRGISKIGINDGQVRLAAKALNVSHFTYQDFSSFLITLKDDLGHSVGDQTLINLIEGLEGELHKRELI